MRVMVLVKATRDSERGNLPTPELLEARPTSSERSSTEEKKIRFT